jgi:hypothetical protein
MSGPALSSGKLNWFLPLWPLCGHRTPFPFSVGERGGRGSVQAARSAPARVAWTECPPALNSAIREGCSCFAGFAGILRSASFAGSRCFAWLPFALLGEPHRARCSRGSCFFQRYGAAISMATWGSFHLPRFSVSSQSPELGTCGKPLDLFSLSPFLPHLDSLRFPIHFTHKRLAWPFSNASHYRADHRLAG